jgi:catalase
MLYRTHNGFATDDKNKYANGQVPVHVKSSVNPNNGAPRAGTHEEYYKN